MTILFLTKEYNHPKMPSYGGAGSFIKIIAHDLTKKGHKVHVFGTHKNGLHFTDQDINLHFVKKFAKAHPVTNLLASASKKLNLTNLYVKFKLKEYNYWAAELKKYVANKNIDIIEAWDYGGFFMKLNMLNIPTVIRCHGSAGFLNKYFGYNDVNQYFIFEKIAFKNYEHIIAVSDYSKRINQTLFKKDTITVINNGIDTALFSPLKDKDTTIIKNSIFYFGTLSEQKGTYNLAEIFNKTLEHHENATLHLIGKGAATFQYIKAHILTAKALANTTYYDLCNYTDMPALLRQAHVIVFPTKGENFPFSFLEAMALEKPVIVSDIAVSSEIITHGKDGLIATSNSDFVSKINTIFNDAMLAEKLAKNARKKIVANFTVSKMSEDTLTYYQSVIDASGPPLNYE
ncbi:glycosyltransferase family 4 protein [Bizionia sediminis]|uniref:Glycosyltransferase family 4 protein n=1 Tax=Bizionia sediminis TaxID=1737064 RepID=A0ABW5KPC7_9FLAO